MAEQREWKNGKPGKLEGQKLKSLLVIQYILKHVNQEAHPPGIPEKDVLPAVVYRKDRPEGRS